MPDAIVHKTPLQWAALVGAGTLVWLVLWNVGTQFRDYMRVDMEQLVSKHITDHDKAAAASRLEFFRAIESRADAAVSNIRQLEQNCAVVQSRLTGIDSHLVELNRWRTECGNKMAGVQTYIGRDESDIRKIETRLERIEELVSKGKRQ